MASFTLKASSFLRLANQLYTRLSVTKFGPRLFTCSNGMPRWSHSASLQALTRSSLKNETEIPLAFDRQVLAAIRLKKELEISVNIKGA